MPPDITPVILAGGQGTRLRPLTAKERPKPFLKLFSGKSLLRHTAERTAEFAAPVVVCDAAHSEKAREDLDGFDPMIICEPVGRSTTPAIALAAFAIEDKETLMLVMPSDHYLEDAEVLQTAVKRAAAMMKPDDVFILAVPATQPEGRYGYIHAMPAQEEGIYSVTSFIEKPGEKKARIFQAQTGWFWNTGIFLTRPQHYLKILQALAPEIYQSARQSWEKRQAQPPFFQPDSKAYINCPSISVDYAIMEIYGETGYNPLLIPLATGWHDIGCWSGLLNVKIKAARELFLKKDTHDRPRNFRERSSR
jgi:mannose-1-phosphate guanylyltransferase/mannose-6-phosphate isomerase